MSEIKIMEEKFEDTLTKENIIEIAMNDAPRTVIFPFLNKENVKVFVDRILNDDGFYKDVRNLVIGKDSYNILQGVRSNLCGSGFDHDALDEQIMNLVNEIKIREEEIIKKIEGR